ncbi:MAG: hypothetical protein ACE37F_25245 [Nannocystaceae bacterium]|nr:hypothetical protein [bacterium]
MPIQIEKIEREERRARRRKRPLGDKIYEFLRRDPKNAFELEEIMAGLGDRSDLLSLSQTPGQFFVSAALELAVALTDKHAETRRGYEEALKTEVGKGRVRRIEHDGATYYAAASVASLP